MAVLDRVCYFQVKALERPFSTQKMWFRFMKNCLQFVHALEKTHPTESSLTIFFFFFINGGSAIKQASLPIPV